MRHLSGKQGDKSDKFGFTVIRVWGPGLCQRYDWETIDVQMIVNVVGICNIAWGDELDLPLRKLLLQV